MALQASAKYKTPEEMKEKIDEYFETKVWSKPMLTAEGKPIVYNGKIVYDIKPPTISGLALHLGFASRQSIYDYKRIEEFSYIINRAITTCEQYAEEQLTQGNFAGAAFWLKNKWNVEWKDRTENDVNINNYSLFQEKVKEKSKKYENKK